MHCMLEFCIYNKNNTCSLDKIETNAYGMCENCIFVTVSKELLNNLKEKQNEDWKNPLIDEFSL